MNKILYIGGFELPDRNAAAHRVISVAKTMRNAGYDVDFIGVTKRVDEVGKKLAFDGFTYTSIAYPIGTIQWLKFITKFLSCEEIDKRNPDAVVLYNFPAVAQKRITRYCHSKGIKVIADLTEWYIAKGMSLHDMIKRRDTNLRMLRYNFQIDGIITISRYLQTYYRDKVKTLYMPATVDLNDTKWHRENYFTIHRPIRIVYAGSYGGGKQKERIDVLVTNIRERSGFELNVFGISEEQYIETFDRTYTPVKNITFHGRVPHDKALEMVGNSDFEVIMRDDNLVTKAGFPTKFVEAMSCGTPVIANPSSNICDYLKDGVNGFLVTEFQTLKQCLDRVEKMTDEEILELKKEAKSLKAFDYRNYLSEFKSFIVSL